jgi:DegV family protein with EDD domain
MTPLTLANTAIVTDSTADPPAGYFERTGVRMVPLKVHFGDETFRDLVDLGPDEFYDRLETAPVLPTTSQPTVGEFKACYEELAASHEHVFSFHLSSKLSGTYQAAAAAADGVANVDVYDTLSVSMGVTMLIERVRARLADGIELPEARAYVQKYIHKHHILFQVSTLEYLRRGGRLGRAQSMVGDVLGIRPLITIAGGELVPYAKVRGERRALETMAQAFAEWSAPGGELYYTVWGGRADDKVALLDQALRGLRPAAKEIAGGRVGAVVGTHGGPGVFAFCMIVE